MFGTASPYQNLESGLSLESAEPSYQPNSPSQNLTQRDLDQSLANGFQGDLQHALKKRKLNDGSFQSHATTPGQTTPQQPKIGADHPLIVDLNFPIISEVEENPTPSNTCTTPFKEGTSISLETSGDLKRRILSTGHQREALVHYNRFFSDSKHGNLNRSLNLEAFGSLQASQILESNIEDNQDEMKNENEWYYERRSSPSRLQSLRSQIENEQHIDKSRFDMPPPVRVNTPSKRKIVVPKMKGGSQSVCKFPSESLNSWSSQKVTLKPTTPAASELQAFKAKPMPRFVPFEAKKSDRPCVIPQEFHLMTEERGRMKEETLRRKVEDKERMSSIQRGFRAGPLPNGNSYLDDHAQSQGYRTTRQSNSREMSEERSRFASRSVSKDNFMEGFTSSQHFRALPMPDFSRPFKPRIGVAPLTEVDERVLNTKARAERRAVFENYLREKDYARELAKQEEEEEKKKREKEEIAELRKQMVFRARPYGNSSVVKSGQKERPSYSPGVSTQHSMEKTMQNSQ